MSVHDLRPEDVIVNIELRLFAGSVVMQHVILIVEEFPRWFAS